MRGGTAIVDCGKDAPRAGAPGRRSGSHRQRQRPPRGDTPLPVKISSIAHVNLDTIGEQVGLGPAGERVGGAGPPVGDGDRGGAVTHEEAGGGG